MKTVGLIGFGAIGRHIVSNWPQVESTYRLHSVLGRPAQLDELRSLCEVDVLVTDETQDFLADLPDIVIEAAGHQAVRTLAPDVLASGRQLYLLSIGILADEHFAETLKEASRRGGGRILIPAGALAGFDGLMALHASGLRHVRYTSKKPAFAWDGTPGADLFDLGAMMEATVIFQGSARDAARLYPKNANLAAAVAMAGIGLDATDITLIADPALAENVGEVEAEGDLGKLFVRVSGEADASNPKTSAIVGASVISALTNQAATLSFI